MISPPPGLSVSLSFTHFHFSLYSPRLSPPLSPFRSLSEDSSKQTYLRAHTWSPGRVFLQSLARLPPHFISKDCTGESLTHTHFLFLLFHVNGFQTCAPFITPVKHTRRHRRNQGLCDCAFLRSAYLLCATTHKHTHTKVHTLPSLSSEVLKQQ